MTHIISTKILPHPLYERLSEICPGDSREVAIDKLIVTIQRCDIGEYPFLLNIVAANDYGSASFGVYPTGVEGMRIKGKNFARVPFPKQFQPPNLNDEELKILASARANAVLEFIEFIGNPA